MEIAVGATACVRYLEVVRFSESPLNRGFTGKWKRRTLQDADTDPDSDSNSDSDSDSD